MSKHTQIEQFKMIWNHETANTLRLFDALPEAKYDFRPYSECRSIGELAWHLAEIEAYFTLGVANGKLDFSAKLPELVRPREIKALAPGFKKVHELALARIEKLKNEDMDRTMVFFDGSNRSIGDVLWGAMLYHMIHHRGQLAMMCRMAGGTAPGFYGPNREEMAAMLAAREAAQK